MTYRYRRGICIIPIWLRSASQFRISPLIDQPARLHVAHRSWITPGATNSRTGLIITAPRTRSGKDAPSRSRSESSASRQITISSMESRVAGRRFANPDLKLANRPLFRQKVEDDLGVHQHPAHLEEVTRPSRQAHDALAHPPAVRTRLPFERNEVSYKIAQKHRAPAVQVREGYRPLLPLATRAPVSGFTTSSR